MPIGPGDELFDSVVRFQDALNPESDRGCALAAASFLEAATADLLRAFLVVQPKKADKELFAGHGPLSTQSGRIAVAYALGLIGKDLRQQLDLVREIRNRFGHNVEVASFEQPDVRDRCRRLPVYDLPETVSTRARFISSVVGMLAVLYSATRKLERRRPADESLSEEEQRLRAKVEELFYAIVEGAP